MKMSEYRILILGATGMLGSTLLRELSSRDGLDVHASARSSQRLDHWFPPALLTRIHTSVAADNFDSVTRVLVEVQPDVVINCIGVIKQLAAAKDPLACITINAS